MVDLSVDKNYILDLHDDVFGNYDDGLYKFLDNDPVKAFYFGSLIKKWFPELDQKRQLLYSKPLRHVSDCLQTYSNQIKFWTDKYTDGEELELIEFSEYLLNNMFFDKEEDIIDIALFLGSKVELKDEDAE